LTTSIAVFANCPPTEVDSTAGCNMAGPPCMAGATIAVAVIGRDTSAIAAAIKPSDSSSFAVSHPPQNFERESFPSELET